MALAALAADAVAVSAAAVPSPVAGSVDEALMAAWQDRVVVTRLDPTGEKGLRCRSFACPTTPGQRPPRHRGWAAFNAIQLEHIKAIVAGAELQVGR